MVTKIRENRLSFAQSLCKAFTDPIVNLFRALLGHPKVSDYEQIPSIVDHKLATTYSEFDRAMTARAWLSCFFSREATLDKAADNVSRALVDLKHSLDRTTVDRKTTQALVDGRIEFIMQAVSYVESPVLTDEQRDKITKGLISLQDYQRYFGIYNKCAYQEATGVKDPVIESSKSKEETLIELADRQGLRLEAIAKDIEQGSGDASTLRLSAEEIKRNLIEVVLPELKKIKGEEEYRGFIEYLNELHSRIFPLTWTERLLGTLI